MVWVKEEKTSESNLADRPTLTATAAFPNATQLEGDALRAAKLAAPLDGTVVMDQPAQPSTGTTAGTGAQPTTPPPTSAVPEPDPLVSFLKELNTFSETQTWWYEEGARYTGPDYDRALRYFCTRQGRMIQAQRRLLKSKGIV